jgi:hypothetical protein
LAVPNRSTANKHVVVVVSYFAGGSWVCVDPGGLSGLPPGIWLAPPEFGAAEFGAAGVTGAAPVVRGAAGAGRTVEGLP